MASQEMLGDDANEAERAVTVPRERRLSTSSKLQTLGRKLRTSTANFFGVGDEQLYNADRWDTRRDHLLMKKCGKIKDGKQRASKQDGFDDLDGGRSLGMQEIHDPLAAGRYQRAYSAATSVSSFRRPQRFQPRRKTRKDSVLRMTYDGLSSLLSPKKKRFISGHDHLHMRTYAPASVATYDDVFTEPTASVDRLTCLDDELVDEVFFDLATPGALSHPVTPAFEMEKPPLHDVIAKDLPTAKGWRRRPPQPIPSTPGTDVMDGIGFSRATRKIVEKAIDNNDRRQYGMGVLGKLFNRSLKKGKLSSDAKKDLETMELANFRPYFTYWVTFVQIVVYIVSVAVYGIAPIGFEETRVSAEVIMPSGVIEQVSRVEKDNLWIGPRQEDLIHLGAKYSPCMRKDMNVVNAIKLDQLLELAQTVCCIRNDGAGCVQSNISYCSKSHSSYSRWTAAAPEKVTGMTSGPVCGEDPRFCTKPAHTSVYPWSKNFTEWPICLNTTKPTVTSNRTITQSSHNRHMTCEITGRPCCIGIHGRCQITTREHCEFMRGYFHEEAFLCSQVNCMHEICGMIPFAKVPNPDQIYRLWISLFLHAGLFHLVVTFLLQFFIMRDLEKMVGPVRLCLIYMGAGIAGNLGSAIFLPYQVEAGPAGSQFGILACLFGEYIQNWGRFKKPWIGMLKMLAGVLLLFIIGLLPWIDNYAHLFGMLFGLLLSFIFLPYITFGKRDKRRRIITLVVCSISVVALFVMLILLFYVTPIYQCPYCKYFNCVPITPKFCDSMDVDIRRSEYL
ncbi:inactive rhomboid protein 1-like [Lineus longissimus]|uniref:inactive rhomboid protein 1-like n=1 Tax=Lineus longissimus TaxID=88925 RepID=UPI002B4CE2DE